jgi:hypothetical protein
MTTFGFGVTSDTTAAYSDSPRSYYAWRLHHARISLVAGAGAGTRRVIIGHGPAAGQGEYLADTGSQNVASTTYLSTGGVSAEGEGGAVNEPPPNNPNRVVWSEKVNVGGSEVLWITATLITGDAYTWDIGGDEHLSTEDTS